MTQGEFIEEPSISNGQDAQKISAIKNESEVQNPFIAEQASQSSRSKETSQIQNGEVENGYRKKDQEIFDALD